MYKFFAILNLVLLVAVYFRLRKVLKFHTRWLINIENLLKEKNLCEDPPSEWTSAFEDRTDAQIKTKIKALRKSVIQHWNI